jgi:DNA-binding PadR family transcriptional regulator
MRKRFVSLSPKGSEALSRSLPLWREAQRHFVDHVGEQYWRSMQEELGKLSNVTRDLEKAAKRAGSTL